MEYEARRRKTRESETENNLQMTSNPSSTWMQGLKHHMRTSLKQTSEKKTIDTCKPSKNIQCQCKLFSKNIYFERYILK